MALSDSIIKSLNKDYEKILKRYTTLLSKKQKLLNDINEKISKEQELLDQIKSQIIIYNKQNF